MSSLVSNWLEQLFLLEGRTAIVAGGAGVIGTVMAGALLKAGANVAIWSRTQDSIDRALAQLTTETDAADRVAGFQVDTGDEEDVAQALRDTTTRWTPPNILINAVGGNLGKGPFIATDTAQFEEILHLNLMAGLVIPTKVVAAFWIDNGIRGSIINLTSMTSYTPLSGVWGYDAAKAGVLNLTQATANEFARYGIRVNAIAPGFFLGKQNKALLIDEKTGDYTPRGQAVIARTPFGRFGDPAELAGATLFLASEKASGFVTGVSIPVDGGYLIHNI
jgi:NAD(P)-dependent dehydrogenase (short-subunit alcohol dehydrogenase family)